MDPNIIRKPWTEEEDQLMLKYRKQFGNKWSEIKNYIPGRTANQIKNRFFSHFAESLNVEEKKNLKKLSKSDSERSNENNQYNQIGSVFVPSNIEYFVIQNSPRYY